MTNALITPVESLETLPLRVRRYELRRDSGARAIRRRGIVRELEFLEPAEVTLLANGVSADHGVWRAVAGAGIQCAEQWCRRRQRSTLPRRRTHDFDAGRGGWGNAD
jgi:N-methylhydantoinase B/oxoprolinase/acetone carboxylase alpha subunit